jgi:hypothetical protein
MNYVEDVSVDGRIILIFILKAGGRKWICFISFTIRTNGRPL